MKFLIISPGKAHDYTVADGIAEYEKRLSKTWALQWAHPKSGDKESEAAAILKLIKAGDHVVLLDERGRDIDTPGFADMLGKQVQSGTKRLVFVIGGAFGVSDEVAKRADATIKLSSLVFPHMLVRLILSEQLYRAHSVLSGGKYHHE
ncbi:MAG TPA: 23S rRNA (pseudouridine(1915)-N(3))-methyltransferase RlmH [Candidatus Paceibacterota bacterium]|jgi:23S rRNA (pseudouridine1915-N3)-methyltransferase|nr:23S rRNA (pseudouridine(1915)-N(3))-methyltransferase RlmH [Candidatus Paceibacterota bacterium]